MMSLMLVYAFALTLSIDLHHNLKFHIYDVSYLYAAVLFGTINTYLLAVILLNSKAFTES